jgi:hypothetical protein
MAIFNYKKRYLLIDIFFYKSEKSEGKSSILSISTSNVALDSFQKILFPISSIFSKILSGLAYFSTSSHNSFHNIGKTKIVNTVITIPITAYLIVFIAGLIFSSFPHDKINSKPHQRINTIDNIHETKTNHEIANKIKSQKLIFASNIGLVAA